MYNVLKQLAVFVFLLQAQCGGWEYNGRDGIADEYGYVEYSDGEWVATGGVE